MLAQTGRSAEGSRTRLPRSSPQPVPYQHLSPGRPGPSYQRGIGFNRLEQRRDGVGTYGPPASRPPRDMAPAPHRLGTEAGMGMSLRLRRSRRWGEIRRPCNGPYSEGARGLSQDAGRFAKLDARRAPAALTGRARPCRRARGRGVSFDFPEMRCTTVHRRRQRLRAFSGGAWSICIPYAPPQPGELQPPPRSGRGASLLLPSGAGECYTPWKSPPALLNCQRLTLFANLVFLIEC